MITEMKRELQNLMATIRQAEMFDLYDRIDVRSIELRINEIKHEIEELERRS